MSSSSEQDRAREIATRIARRVSRDATGEAARAPEAGAGDVGEELAAVRETLSELQTRLARIESHITRDEERPREHGATAAAAHREDPSKRPPTFARSPWLSGIYVPAAHPSQEKFGVDEASLLSELVDYFEKEKTCSLEPGGKPCDHCEMCSTRGF